MTKVLIPTPLRQFTGKQDCVSVAGATVGEVLSALTAQFPDLRKQIFNDEGKMRSFINVYLNDEDVRVLDGLDTNIGDQLQLNESDFPQGTTLIDYIIRFRRDIRHLQPGVEPSSFDADQGQRVQHAGRARD